MTRAIASPRTLGLGPAARGDGALYAAAIGRLERDLGIPVEEVEPSTIFRTGNPGEDWFTTVAAEELA